MPHKFLSSLQLFEGRLKTLMAREHPDHQSYFAKSPYCLIRLLFGREVCHANKKPAYVAGKFLLLIPVTRSHLTEKYNRLCKGRSR